MTLPVLLAGFAAAVVLRVGTGGDDPARSLPAGLVFAACLLLLSRAARTRLDVSARALGLGLLGALVLCLPVGLEGLLALRPLRSTDGFATWALVVLLVVLGEELFLRGALYDAVASPRTAIVLGALLFGLLHVPLYGWHAVPLDVAVGLVLGGLRRESGSPAAPFVAHAGADLVGWFLS